MRRSILISSAMCNTISIILVISSLFGPLVLPSARAEALVYMLSVFIFAFVGGWMAYAIISLLARSRLKARMPEWKKEITKSNFCRLCTSRPAQDDILSRILISDADFTQIEAERELILKYMRLWVYPPTAANILVILYYMLQL